MLKTSHATCPQAMTATQLRDDWCAQLLITPQKIKLLFSRWAREYKGRKAAAAKGAGATAVAAAAAGAAAAGTGAAAEGAAAEGASALLAMADVGRGSGSSVSLTGYLTNM